MSVPWTAKVLTLFPDMFPGPLSFSLAGKGLEEDIWRLETVDIRGFARDKHRSVDDTPAGGGPGMVMRCDVLADAVDAVRAGDGPAASAPLVFPGPRGRPLTQAMVRDWASAPGVVFICGRFEGVDQRLLEARPIEEVSLGDFVLSGGEPAAMAMMDAVVRLLPGIMGADASGEDESFETGLLEYPHYTRPRVWEGRKIPEVLVSGDHGRIAAWRRAQAEALTQSRRPDLWAAYERCRSGAAKKD